MISPNEDDEKNSNSNTSNENQDIFVQKMLNICNTILASFNPEHQTISFYTQHSLNKIKKLKKIFTDFQEMKNSKREYNTATQKNNDELFRLLEIHKSADLTEEQLNYVSDRIEELLKEFYEIQKIYSKKCLSYKQDMLQESLLDIFNVDPPVYQELAEEKKYIDQLQEKELIKEKKYNQLQETITEYYSQRDNKFGSLDFSNKTMEEMLFRYFFKKFL